MPPTTNITDMFDDTFDVILRPPGRRFGGLPHTVPFQDGDMDKLPLSTLLHGLYARLPLDVCREIRRMLWEPLTDRTIRIAVTEWTHGANSRWGPIELWDVHQVSIMNKLFVAMPQFNADVSRWDVSHVTSMATMFSGCLQFNVNLSRWDVSRVINMRCVFDGCEAFNQPLDRWDVSNVRCMRGMLACCARFNQTIGN